MITVDDISKSVDIFKNGGWIYHQVPDKWHYEEQYDICEWCGENHGKIEVQVVDKYKTVKEYIHPGDYNSDMILLSPEIEKTILRDEDDK